MAFFKPQVAEVDFETQDDLPGFSVDANGFILFDDPMLGGCGVYEVVPTVMERAVTHLDTMSGPSPVDTDAEGRSGSGLMQFADRRGDAVRQWVALLSSLMPSYDRESQTHAQVVVKKSRLPESDGGGWRNGYGHAAHALRGGVGFPSPRMGPAATARRAELVSWLERMEESSSSPSPHSRWGGWQYDLQMYLVVSYTPSGERFWFDGRDSDYYVADTPADRRRVDASARPADIAERIGSMLASARERRHDRGQVNTAAFTFDMGVGPDASEDEARDHAAAVIEARMRKIEDAMVSHAARAGGDRVAFELRRTHPTDVTALVAFWPDSLTDYRFRVAGMAADVGDAIGGVARRTALATGDAGYLRGMDVDVDGYMGRYVGLSASDIDAIEAGDAAPSAGVAAPDGGGGAVGGELRGIVVPAGDLTPERRFVERSRGLPYRLAGDVAGEALPAGHLGNAAVDQSRVRRDVDAAADAAREARARAAMSGGEGSLPAAPGGVAAAMGERGDGVAASVSRPSRRRVPAAAEGVDAVSAAAGGGGGEAPAGDGMAFDVAAAMAAAAGGGEEVGVDADVAGDAGTAATADGERARAEREAILGMVGGRAEASLDELRASLAGGEGESGDGEGKSGDGEGKSGDGEVATEDAEPAATAEPTPQPEPRRARRHVRMGPPPGSTGGR